MKRKIWVLLAAALLLLTGFARGANDEYAARAEAVVKLLFAGEYAEAAEAVSEAAQGQLTEAVLEQAMAQITSLYGAPERCEVYASAKKQGYHVVELLCQLENGNVMFTLTLDSEQKLAGLFAAPSTKAFETEEGSTPEGVVTESVTLRAGEADETKGELTLPEGEGPFPVAILLAGSGPNDMDETIYQNKPLRDIAYGLALRGVASLRYDKYTYAHASLLEAESVTVYDEYERDALEALALVQSDARFGKIFLLGHSQGAMLVPRIMKTCGAEAFAGGVLLAGSPLPLWKLQYAQNLEILASLEGEEYDAAKAMLDAELGKVEALEALEGGETFFGAPVAYQIDEMRVDAVKTAIENDVPLFFAQGDADFQVRVENGVDAWQTALAGWESGTYRCYAGLNHLLMPAGEQETGTTNDYMAKESVSEDLLDDIVAWMGR